MADRIINTTFDADGQGLAIKVVGKGTDGKELAPIHLDLRKVHKKLRNYAELHGWKQRCSDGGALTRDTKTGASATPKAKWERIKSIVDHYESGVEDWTMKAMPRPFDLDLCVRAMMRAFGVDEAEANRKIDSLATVRKLDKEAAAKIWADTKQVLAATAAIIAETAPASSDDLDAEIAAMAQQGAGEGTPAEAPDASSVELEAEREALAEEVIKQAETAGA